MKIKKTKPFWNKKQIEKIKEYLSSPEGKAKATEMFKGESDIDKWTRQAKEAAWWYKIKDEPFTI